MTGILYVAAVVLYLLAAGFNFQAGKPVIAVIWLVGAVLFGAAAVLRARTVRY